MIIGLSGGLGNQIFQYALGLSISQKRQEELCLDTYFYKNYPGREFELDFYSVPYKEKKEYIWYNKVRLYVQRIPFISGFLGIIKEKKEFEYDARIDKFSYHYYTGYWQNIKYLTGYKKELQHLFRYPLELTVSQKDTISNMNRRQSVAIHVRHGDYASEQFKNTYYIQNEKYYRNAIAKMRQHILNDDIDFYFFSDDILWCKEVFSDVPNSIFVDEELSPTHHSDFMLMRKCKHFIIANSTFSWWGAWLKEQDGVVIVPAKWYYDDRKNKKVISALVEPEWIVLDDN